MLKTLFKYFINMVVLVVFCLIAYREVALLQIPDVQKTIPVKVSRDEVPIPRRPGTRSIRIVGPPIKILKFQIDFTKSPKPIDWYLLERIDKRAAVTIEGNIDVYGNFNILHVDDGGHPRAGSYLQDILETWKFVQYKSGTIKYYFNVPTRMENMKVQIDMRDLKKNLRYIGPRTILKDGLLYYVEGLTRNNVMILN